MNPIHIMIVEDDDILAREIKDFLIRWGYQAVTATHFENIMQDFMNDEYSSRKLEYPIVMNLIADSPEEAIADSHHFSVVTDGE